MIYIYQIGRLDTNITKEINFKIREEKILESLKYPLSSLALKQHFLNARNSTVKVILAYPVSLPFNENLICDRSQIPPNLKEKIKQILSDLRETQNYLRNPEEFFKLHPYSEGNEFFVIHSIGEYKGQKFDGKFDDIVIEFFIDMLERIKVVDETEIYVDVSTGLNVYVSAMLEAVRHFSTYYHLSEWENRKLKIFIVFTDPIIGSPANEFNIYKDYELKFKHFFSSPIKKEDIDSYTLARKIAGDNGSLKNQIQNFLKNFALSFSAIKNNTPLVVYTFGYNNEILENEFIARVKSEIKKDWIKSPNFDKDTYFKLFLTLAFYCGIIKVLRNHSIFISSEVKIEQMKEKFENIYKIFNLTLNENFLGNEVSNLIRKLRDKDMREWTLLNKVLEGRSGSKDPRNFFAHSGLEGNITEVKKVNNEILIRYKENEKAWIEKCLIDHL